MRNSQKGDGSVIAGGQINIFASREMPRQSFVQSREVRFLETLMTFGLSVLLSAKRKAVGKF